VGGAIFDRGGAMKEACLLLALNVWCVAALGQGASSAPQQVEIAPGVSISIPAPWFVANQTTNGVEIQYPSSIQRPGPPPNEKHPNAAELITADARIAIVVEQRGTHANAIERLAQIAAEESERPQLLVIAGWPALQRERKGPLPNPGESDSPANVISTFATTAIAADTMVVRFEAVLAPDADPKLADAAFQIAKQVHLPPGNDDAAKRDLETLSNLIATQQSNTKSTGEPEPPAAPGGGAPKTPAPGTSLVQNGIGELEVVISSDGLHVVVAANSGYSYSDDGGQHFTFGGPIPCIYPNCDGDPSLAVGKSGAVYFSWIGYPIGATADSLSISKTNGHSFTFLSNAVVCPKATPKLCTLPDQEHIAADRKNLSTSGKDRVYLVWRNFSGVGLTPRIVCSSNGGATWSSQVFISGNGDLPRVTVGGDGFVYAVYISGSTIALNKFSTCDGGLVQQVGFPNTVASYTIVACPLAGLDRCNCCNTMSSQMVAVDDTNPSHVFVAFGNNTSANNDDILVYDSIDGGKTWKDKPVKANTNVSAPRFMPWVCTAGGTAAVSWYDRRAATKAAPDLTAYYRGSVKRVSPLGVLQAYPEEDVSGTNDPQCASGFPGGEDNSLDASLCPPPPQLAGECLLPCNATKNGCSGSKGSATPCYFNGPKAKTICKSPEYCQAWGGGVPKYGDYNGNACTPTINEVSIPTICTAWASATPPKGVHVEGSSGIQIYASCTRIEPPAVTITYHQTGACNGYTNSFGLVSAGSNFAYVLFGIESIDNSLGASAFAFDPSRLFVHQTKPKTVQDFVDPGLQLYTDILGPFAAVPTTVPAGDDMKFAVSAQTALVVSTTNSNGSVEANQTPYFLVYDRKPADPPVNMVKSDAKQNSWPNTEDCKTISLH
jgi:hypothetical protein